MPPERRPLRILGFSDTHSPHHVGEVVAKLERSCREETPDLVLFAGDLVDRGRWDKARLVNDALERVLGECGDPPLLGVFGNDDWEIVLDKIRAETPRFTWLEDRVEQLSVSGWSVRVWGSTGILDRPTKWQRENIPDIHERYERRLRMLDDFLSRPKAAGELYVVLTHYPPTYKTLEGEPRFAWPEMGSLRAENSIRAHGTLDLALHGHAHKSRRLEARVGKAVIVNAAFPARRDVVRLRLPRVLGLDAFLGV